MAISVMLAGAGVGIGYGAVVDLVHIMHATAGNNACILTGKIHHQ
jgi:hypothetical protein